jgi:hypothetical protein
MRSQILVTSLDHPHAKVRELLKCPRFRSSSIAAHHVEQAWYDRRNAFTIMKIAGHSSTRISQRYVHPSPECRVARFEELEVSNPPVAEETGGHRIGHRKAKMRFDEIVVPH